MQDFVAFRRSPVLDVINLMAREGESYGQNLFFDAPFLYIFVVVIFFNILQARGFVEGERERVW